MDRAEVVVAAEPHHVRTLFPEGLGTSGPLNLGSGTSAGRVQELVEGLQVDAEVRWAGSPIPAVYRGQVVRIESSLDPL